MSELTQEAEKDIALIIRECEGLQVVDERTLLLAGDWITKIVQVRKNIHEYYDEPISDAYKLHKKLIAKRSEIEDPLGNEEERLRESRQAYLKVKVAMQEKDRKAIADKTEENLKFIERQFKDQLISEQEYYDKQQAAGKILEGPTKMGEVKKYFGEVTDLRALVTAIHNCEAPLECIIPNERFINAFLQKTQGGVAIPGVEIDYKIYDRIIERKKRL